MEAVAEIMIPRHDTVPDVTIDEDDFLPGREVFDDPLVKVPHRRIDAQERFNLSPHPAPTVLLDEQGDDLLHPFGAGAGCADHVKLIRGIRSVKSCRRPGEYPLDRQHNREEPLAVPAIFVPSFRIDSFLILITPVEMLRM